ncbi:MAG: hypothetical protein KatS3mg035_0547 [Bacteroidia bacterium]|nr:MAG: hypothetical protein KatS3mg035_0547 [Bacteroidia bacterium]
MLVTFLLSNILTKPIRDIAEQLDKLDFADERMNELNIKTNSFELKYLITRFNQLIQRTNDTFSFQKHTIQHISHQLKTPIAILVSELERIQKMIDSAELKADIETLIVKAKSLGNIINTLLEISKIDSGSKN